MAESATAYPGLSRKQYEKITLRGTTTFPVERWPHYKEIMEALSIPWVDE